MKYPITQGVRLLRERNIAFEPHVYAYEKTMFDLPLIYINGGKRGFLVSLNPKDLDRALKITEVSVAIT